MISGVFCYSKGHFLFKTLIFAISFYINERKGFIIKNQYTLQHTQQGLPQILAE